MRTGVWLIGARGSVAVTAAVGAAAVPGAGWAVVCWPTPLKSEPMTSWTAPWERAG